LRAAKAHCKVGSSGAFVNDDNSDGAIISPPLVSNSVTAVSALKNDHGRELEVHCDRESANLSGHDLRR
jgi:hypothetical protein